MAQSTKTAEKNMYDAIITNQELYNHFIRARGSRSENTCLGFSHVNKNLLYQSLLQELVESDSHSHESFYNCLQTVISRLKTTT